MGDIANSAACDAFIMAFADDIVRKYRSPFLDLKFEDQVRYYVMADDNWEVHLYAAIKTGAKDASGHEEEENFRIETCPTFWPTTIDTIDEIAAEFDVNIDEVVRRLQKGAEDAQKEYEDDRKRWEARAIDEANG